MCSGKAGEGGRREEERHEHGGSAAPSLEEASGGGSGNVRRAVREGDAAPRHKQEHFVISVPWHLDDLCSDHLVLVARNRCSVSMRGRHRMDCNQPRPLRRNASPLPPPLPLFCSCVQSVSRRADYGTRLLSILYLYLYLFIYFLSFPFLLRVSVA